MNDKLRSAPADSDAVKEAFPGKVEAMKTKLAAWALTNTGPGNDDAAFTYALLELGIERLLQQPFSDENAFQELEEIINKVVARLGG